MKKLISSIFLFAIALSFMACEPENKYPSSGIQLTPVYGITNISNSALVQMNVYKQKALVVNYLTDVNAFSAVTRDYADTSTDTDFVFQWTVSEERTVSDVVETFTVVRVVNALKADGNGTMVATATYPDGSTEVTNHTVVVTEAEVYN